MNWWPQFILVLLFSLCGTLADNHIITEREYDEEDWHPLRERPVVSRVIIPIPRLRPPTSYSTRADSYATKKRLQLEPSPSNKVEVFAPAPPSILGSFSGFGHATVKAREPAHMKKKHPVREQQLSETRPSYTALLLPPPVEDSAKTRLLYNPYPHDERTAAAAYYYEASLRPPPRDIIPPPQSSNLPPNSFYFDGPKASGQRFQEVANPYQTGFGHSGPGFRSTLPSSPSPFDNGYHQYYNPGTESNRGQTVLPSHRPSLQYYNRNPFGDITLSSRRPELVKPVTEEKPHGKEVFNQLSHLGRPFQNPNLEYTNSQRLRDPFLTTVSSSIQLKDEKKSKNKYSSGQPFHYSQPDFTPSSHYPSPQPNFFVTEAPFTAEIFPLTVKTVDIPPDDDSKEKSESSTPKTNSFINSHKQLSYHNTPIRTHQPHVEISSYQTIRNESPPFLPTPATDVEPFIKEPEHNEEQYNEVQTSLPHVHNNYRYPPYQKPTDESYLDNLSTINTKKPHTSLKQRRRRPTRPTEIPSTVSSEASLNIHEIESEKENSFIPIDNEDNQEDIPTTTPSTTTVRSHRRRKKPNKNRHRVQSNFVQSTTTLAPEPEIYHSSTPGTQGTQGFYYEFSTPAVTDHPDYAVSHSTYVSSTQEPFVNTEPIVNDYVQIHDDINQENIIGTQNYVPTQSVYDTQSSVEDEITEAPTTPIPISSSTTTVTTTIATEPPTSPALSPSTSNHRTRTRNKYGNNTRPRFSVKDYRERLNRASSTTPNPKQDEIIDEDIPKIKYSTRTRGNSFHKQSLQQSLPTGPEENLNESTTEVYRKYKPRVRYNYKTSTTTSSPTLQVDSPSTTTERSNMFRPNINRYKPGTGKYYSRYRTSTESPPTEPNETVSTTSRIRTKGVFSAKRRPYPLRTKPEDTNKENDKETAEETKQYRQTIKTIENEVDPVTTVMSKKMDNAATTTITSTNTEPVLIGPTGEDITTAQRIADLTSSPSNMYQSNGFRKGISPSSRRTVPQITLATEDPILPLEAFFQSWSNNKDKESR